MSPIRGYDQWKTASPYDDEPDNSKLVNSLEDLWESVSGERVGNEQAQALLKKAIYKGTSCGAWIQFRGQGITVGSIVEGVDQETETYDFDFPFYDFEMWEALDAVEEEAKEIWDATHGCEDCGEEDPETNYIPINPNCKSCNGEGTIL